MTGKKTSSSKPDSSRYARARRYGRKSTIILLAILIALVVLGLCGFRFAYATMLPNVIEMSEADATELLEDYGMEVRVQKDWSDKYDEGTVMSQEPKGGAHTSSGETVTIVISKGPQSVSMPELIGFSKEEATDNLSKSGVSWIISEAYSDEVEAGIVISQVPEKDTEVTPEKNVLLVISKGEKSAVRTADDVEVTKKKSTKNKDNKTTTSSTTDDDDDDVSTTETTTSTSTSRNTSSSSNSSSSSNQNSNTSQSSQSSTSESSTDTSTNTDTSTSTDSTSGTGESQKTDDTGSESTGDPGLDEQLAGNTSE